MSWLSQLFNPGGGYKRAEDTSRDYYNRAQGQIQPYADYGTSAGDELTKQLHLLMNPQELQNQWSSSYEESPYAKQEEQGAMDRGLNAAGSMGLLGSSSALSNLQTGASNIMQKDKQQYMSDLMQKYLSGLGIGQNQFNTGANAANAMGQNTMHQGETEAGLNFGKYNAGPNMLAGGANAIMDLIQKYLTGGMGQGDFGRGMWTPPAKGGM